MKILRLRFVLLLIALVSMLFTVASLLLQDVPEFGSLEELVVWIVSGGGAMILAGYVVAYGLENWTKWHTFPLFVKKFTPFVLAAIFSLIGRAILLADLLSYVPASIQVLILTLVAWLFSQLAYKGIKSGAYGESTRDAAKALGAPPTGGSPNG